jgi:hypothetical protein
LHATLYERDAHAFCHPAKQCLAFLRFLIGLLAKVQVDKLATSGGGSHLRVRAGCATAEALNNLVAFKRAIELDLEPGAV